MAYQVYFADLAEENQGLTMALLRMKEEAGEIEPDEAKLLEELRGSPVPWPQAYQDDPQGRPYGQGARRSGGRRGNNYRNRSRRDG